MLELTTPMIKVWPTLLPVGSAAALYWLRLHELGARRETVSGKVLERQTLRWFMLIGTLVFLGAILEFFWHGRAQAGGLPAPRADIAWGSLVPGWACAAAAFTLRRAAIHALGRFWSLHVEIRDAHEFVRSGPFRFVRHPTYLSMILELLALCLILCAPWSAGLGLLALVPALRRRLRTEEAALVEKFGPAYREYQRSTPALFPYRWPSAS